MCIYVYICICNKYLYLLYNIYLYIYVLYIKPVLRRFWNKTKYNKRKHR